MLHDLAAHMNHEDLRLRFFTPVRGLTHAVAARLSQLDYDRELAILAERDGIALGVAHFFADPDKLRAEYAVAVRSDWKGRGVGYLLMTRLIDIARRNPSLFVIARNSCFTYKGRCESLARSDRRADDLMMPPSSKELCVVLAFSTQ